MVSAYRFEEHLEFATLVTPAEAKVKPIYNWFIYPHSFSPSLVWNLMDRFGLKEGQTVFDPFVGAGTTILAAKEKNISAVGLDLLPISAALVRAKVAEYDLVHLQNSLKKIKRVLSKPQPAIDQKISEHMVTMVQSPNSIIAKGFDPQTLTKIIQIKSAIRSQVTNLDEYSFFLTALLSILEEFSLTFKAGGWLKIIAQAANQGDVITTFLARTQVMLTELIVFQSTKHNGTWEVIIGDARELQSNINSVDAIISSPPYLNRHDYTRVLCLELLIGFLDYYDEIADLRHRLLRSHVEAKHISSPIGYKKPASLIKILEDLEQRKAEPRVLYIVDGYFEDMFTVLRTSYHYLANNKFMALVLGNVRFSGLAIPVDEIIAEIGEQIGFSVDAIMVARRRNNSAQQMRDYGRDPSRESIVIMQKPSM